MTEFEEFLGGDGKSILRLWKQRAGKFSEADA